MRWASFAIGIVLCCIGSGIALGQSPSSPMGGGNPPTSAPPHANPAVPPASGTTASTQPAGTSAPTPPANSADAGAPTQPVTRLTAIIHSLRNDRGLVRCALHNDSNAFPTNSRRAVAHAASSISNRTGRCEWTNIRPGGYAVAMHHDEDSDDHFDTGFLGIPLEGYGFSNDARPFLGPPSWNSARFNFAGGQMTLRIRAQY